MSVTSRATEQTPRLVKIVPAGAALLAAVAVAIVLLSSGSTQVPPAAGAAAVVPADALAYVHVSIDPQRPAVKRGLTLAARFPDYPLATAAVVSRITTILGGGRPADYQTALRPWLGKEAALALLNGSSSAAVIVLDVRNRSRAEAFLTRSGAQALGSYDGVRLLHYPTGREFAFVSHYLVLGQDASLRASIDVAKGKAPSLQSSAAYRSAAAGEPADRVLDFYASAAGVSRLLVARGGLIGAIGALLYQPALTGLTLSVSPTGSGAKMRVHSALDPSLAQVGGGTSRQFTPTLEDVIPSGAIMLLDVIGLDRIAPRVLDAGTTGGVAGEVGPLLSRLGSALASEGVNTQSILSLFDGETAIAISPAGSGASRSPALVIIARTRNEQQTQMQLAALELPLEQLFPTPSSGAGQAPLFNDRQVAGTTVHQLDLAAGLQLNYAVTNGLLIVSTSVDAIAQVITHARTVTHDPGYNATLGTIPQKVTSLVFLDFSQLLSLGEQTGLVRSSRYRAIRADLAKIRAVGLSSTRGESDSTAELSFQIP